MSKQPTKDQTIRCPECGNTLGVRRSDGLTVSRRAGRAYLNPDGIACERKDCRGVWRPAANSDSAARPVLWLVRQEKPAASWREVAWLVLAVTQEQAIDVLLRDRADTFPFLYLPESTDLRAFLRSMDWRQIPQNGPAVVFEHADVY